MRLLGPKKCSIYSLGVLRMDTLQAKLLMSSEHLDGISNSWASNTLSEVELKAGFLRPVILDGHTWWPTYSQSLKINCGRSSYFSPCTLYIKACARMLIAP